MKVQQAIHLHNLAISGALLKWHRDRQRAGKQTMLRLSNKDMTFLAGFVTVRQCTRLSYISNCTAWSLTNDMSQLQRVCSCKCIEKACVAGLILENVRCGREKHIWLSTAADLRIDARRDLDDIKAQEVDLHALNRQPLLQPELS